MYKVFIENRPIIFTKINSEGNGEPFILSRELQSIEFDLVPRIVDFPENEVVFIGCDVVEEEMDRLFAGHEMITAAGGIVERKGEFLFIERNGKWDLPKGKVEVNETVEDAATREIEEECGIQGLEWKSFICVTYHTYVFKEKQVLKKTIWFAFDYASLENGCPQLEEGISAVNWLKESEMEVVRRNTYASILDVLDTYFLVKEASNIQE
jgi:8-oxo-dGTP pyrophosphatase MutT (NUDIX family)